MRKKYEIKDGDFAGGLFSRALDRYYISEFITHLKLRDTEYAVFRLIYFFTDQHVDGGYMTYKRSEIASELGVSKSCIDRAIKRLMDRGLIICEPVQREGKLCPGYRVDKQDIKRRIETVEKERCSVSATYKAPSERELAPKVTEGDCGTKESAITTLAEEELSHSPSTRKAPCGGSCRAVTEGEGGTKESAITTLAEEELSHSPSTRKAPCGGSCRAVTEGEGGTKESDITTLAEEELSHSPSTASGPPPSRREA